MNDRRTMITAFSPPDGLIGTSALMCGLSADVATVELLLAEFTGERSGQRRARGVATAVLALDGRCDRTALRTVAGLCVAEPARSWPEGSMLHAKVALLGFAKDPLTAPQRLRLVVSTGNWTAAGLSEHIDMLWIVDFNPSSGGQETARADVAAAAGFFRSLLSSDGALFHPHPPSNADGLLAVDADVAETVRPRFVHSMVLPLLEQIGERFVPEGSPWNWLYAGSGFFEQEAASDPVVLKQIDAEFEGKTIRKPNRWVAVNVDRAGAFAARPDQGWTVCEPVVDENRRFMHAKFIAAGRRIGDIHHDVTVYLGSGNLSRSGLLTSFGKGRQSRIEAGVVFGAGRIPDDAIWRMLPDSKEMDPARLAALVKGPGDPPAPVIPPPPVLYARLTEAAGGSRTLHLHKSDPEVPAQVRLNDAVVDVPVGTSAIAAGNFADAYLETKTPEAERWEPVPVLGTDGSFARVRMPPGTVEDLLEALFAFPFVPDAAFDEDGFGDGVGPSPAPAERPEAASIYPARDAMRVVEQVAKLAAAAAAGPPGQVAAVSRSLRRSLVEGLRSEDKTSFAALGIDFTAPLREMPGMPDDEAWTLLVDEVAADWGLIGKPALSLRAFGSGAAT